MKPIAPLVTCVLLFALVHGQTAKKSGTDPKTCGAVLRLDQAGMKRLDLFKQVSAILDNAGFTKSDYDALSRNETEQLVAGSYGLAYLSWNKPESVSREKVNQMVDKAIRAMDRSQLTESEKEFADSWSKKFRTAMIKAFELGRYDALRSPCPF